MVRNDQRRSDILDAAIELVAEQGFSGLSFRVIDAQAGLPSGTTTNYYRSREALIEAASARIGERLGPGPELLERLAGRDPGPELFADYVRDIVRRLLADRAASLALYHLRLAAAQGQAGAEPVAQWQRLAFAGDLEFTARAGLPADRTQVALFHYAIDGYVLDRLTTPIAPDLDDDQVVEVLVRGLITAPAMAGGGR